MNRYRLIFMPIVLMIGMLPVSQAQSASEPYKISKMHSELMENFYNLKVKTLTGEDFDFNQFRGKRVLIVNTASECGSTPQYAQLQDLYELYGGDNFTIIGFPSNDFGSQEPGSNEEIASFCQKNYGVTFPIMEKVMIKGDNIHPLYVWLTQKTQNGVGDAEVKWNFNKFLIDEKGKWVAHLGTKIEPLDDRIVSFAKGEE